MTKKGVIGTEKGGMAEEGCDFRREINQVVFFFNNLLVCMKLITVSRADEHLGLKIRAYICY